MPKVYTTKSSDETVNLGEKIGSQLRGGELITLTGDLGGGKTQLTKGIARGIGITETVVSPTFMIERIYEVPLSATNSPCHPEELGKLSQRREDLDLSASVEMTNRGPSKKLTLHHLDLYRLHNDAEISEQIDEFTGTLGNVTVVEWPENIDGILDKNRLDISFEYKGDDERKITITPVGDEYKKFEDTLSTVVISFEPERRGR